jgi:hypothetical protein
MTKENETPGTATKPKFKLSLDSAKKEINRMMDYYEIEIDEIEDETLKNAIQQGYGRAIKAIRRGRLEVIIEDGIKVIQETKNGTKIEYREIDGEAKTAMDSYPAEAIYKRAYALLGSLSGLGEGVIKKMKGVDLSLAEVLGLIFLAV